MQRFDNVLDLIGNTPVVKVHHFDTGPCELHLKLESANPGGSIKDRIGLYMIEKAESEGRLKPGGTIVEGTAGNTGLALALVAAQKGYRLVLVIPDKMSREKIFNLRAMGADVVMTRSDVGKGHPQYYQDLAKKIANETENALFINQFGNPDNPEAHEHDTGPEIWQQMNEDLDAIVIGCGSSGTVTGLSRYFAKVAPDLEIVLADPEGSILADYVNKGITRDDGGGWMVEGIGEDFFPTISDLSRVSKAYTISDKDSFVTGRELLRKEGILGGSSTGTLLAAALRFCQEQTQRKKVLTLVCDTGNKYLSMMYNDYWMMDQGFIEREHHDDLRDLIMRPYSEHDTVVIGPDEPMTSAYQRMKMSDVSQLPVLDNDKVVGIIDESDLLMAVYDHEDRFKQPVKTAMTERLQVIDVKAPVEQLLPIFDAGHVAIVTEGDKFHGLITRIDLLNYLRRRVD